MKQEVTAGQRLAICQVGTALRTEYAAGGAVNVKTSTEYRGSSGVKRLSLLECFTFNVMSSEQDASNIPEGSHLMALTSF